METIETLSVQGHAQQDQSMDKAMHSLKFIKLYVFHLQLFF